VSKIRLTSEEKKKHSVFEVSSDIKPCFTEKFLLQKLHYIHANPVDKKWQLTASSEAYLHSSYYFYEHNEKHLKIRIVHCKDLKSVADSKRICLEPGDDA
jgi:hypothetical protein